MHEYGVIMEVVKQIEDIAEENDLQKIQTVVLQIGELSSMIPQYMQKIYPIAVDDTILRDSRLEIEVIPGNGRCMKCQSIFNLLNSKGICPECGNNEFELLSGKEFMIKEIEAY